MANRIGAGNPNSSLSTLITTVLRSTCQKRGDANMAMKCSNPTHSLAQMPFSSLKSLKAIWMPYMGPYWNSTK